MMNSIFILTVNEIPENAKAMLKIMIFVVGLMLVFWDINVFRHIKSEKLSKVQRIIDIIGNVMLVLLIILLIIPIL